MANRQYIGARYVPKFYDGTNGTEWDANVTYEPLTIVTYLSNSYTSKKTVPASVGNPIDNPTYWASTGNYNAQVEQYRQDVVNLNARVDGVDEQVVNLNVRVDGVDEQVVNLNARVDGVDEQIEKAINSIGINSIVCIGDSYGGSYPGTRWIARLKTMLGISDDKFFWNATSGGGFAANDGDGHNFLWRLSSVAETMTEEQKKDVTHIVVCGGANDAGVIGSVNISVKINEFCTYARNNFPNAEICIGFIGVAFNGEAVRNYQLAMTIYQQCSTNLKTRYLNGVEWVMYNTSYMEADMLHPNANGSNALAYNIANALRSGSTNVVYEYGTTGAPMNISGRFNNGVVKMTCNSTTIQVKIDNAILNGTKYEIAEKIFPFCFGDVFNRGDKISVILAINGGSLPGGGYGYIPGLLIYEGGKWYISAYYLNKETGQWDSMNITSVGIMAFSKTFSVIE